MIWLSYMVHMWKMVISQVFFYPNFLFFKLLGGQMGKKRSKMTKTKDHLIVVCLLLCICVKDIIYRVFSLFQKFYFSVVSGVKRLKMVQNDKKLCAPISGTIDHMIVIFGTHVENDNISSYFFLFSQNCNFLGPFGNKRAKNSPKWQKILSVFLHILEIMHALIAI